MKAKTIFPVPLNLTASAALAHSDVKNAAVFARIDAMKAIGDATATLGDMAEGAFDADAARAAARTIAAHAAETPALFEAGDLETLAGTLATGLDTPEALRAGLGELGATCKACHSVYRQ